jgi:hypothetical protein
MKKRVISLILALALTLPLCQGLASASYATGDTLEDALSKLNVAWRGDPLDWLAIGGKVRTQTYTYFNFFNDRTGKVEEHPDYCIDPEKGGAKQTGIPANGEATATYIRGEKIGDPTYEMILGAGYPHSTFTSLGLQTTEEGYYATKMALWMYILGAKDTDVTINPAYAGNPAAQRVYDATLQIFKNGVSWSSLGGKAPTLTVTPDKPVPYLDGTGQYYIQKVTISSNKYVGAEVGTPGGFDLSWQDSDLVPSGTKILAADGSDVTSSMFVPSASTGNAIWSAEITIMYPKDVIDGGVTSAPELKVKAVLAGNNIFTAYYENSPDGYQRYLVEADPKQEVEASLLAQFSPDIEEYEMGLRVLKLETGTLKPLEGAVFDIFDPEGVKIFSLPTDANGEIRVPLARVGNYTVTERIPPHYHILPTHTSQGVTVRYNEVATVTFEDLPFGGLRIEKRDAADGRNLSGAVIQIKNISTGVTQTATTDSSGSVTFNSLPCAANGTGYEVRELTAPTGYALDTTVHTVSVRPMSEGVTSYTLTNKANPGLRIIKLNSATHTPIEGAQFEVWRDGTKIGTYTTDYAGEIFLPNIAAGTYTAKEVFVPAPYQLDTTAQWIELTSGGGIMQLIFVNDAKSGIRLGCTDKIYVFTN